MAIDDMTFFGHLKTARQNIAQVLADKATEGAFSRAEAGEIARRLMLENPNVADKPSALPQYGAPLSLGCIPLHGHEGV